MGAGDRQSQLGVYQTFQQKLVQRLQSEPRQQAPLMVELRGTFPSFFAGKSRPKKPSEIAEEEAGFRRFGESCLLCTVIEAERQSVHRVVIDDERALVVCPYWSGAPYEMLVLPRQHEVHLENTAPPDVVAVGRAVRDALALLRAQVGEVAYNLVFHTAPHHHEGPFHWHVHIVPRLTSLAGFEQGTGVMINIVAPELAARHLSG